MEENTAIARRDVWGIGRTRQPNLDAIRLLLVVCVLFSHSWTTLYNMSVNHSDEWIMQLTCGQTAAGDMAVDGFFALSGALLIESLRRSSSVGTWLTRRAARIYPAWIAALVAFWLFVGYLLLPQPHTMGWVSYLQAMPSHITQIGQHPLFQAVFLKTIWVPIEGFQGFNCNLAAWTLSHEAGCYLILATLGVLFLRRSATAARWVTLLIAVGMLTLYAVQDDGLPNMLPAWKFDILPIPWGGAWPRLLGCFFSGAAFAMWQDLIPRKRVLMLSAVLGLMVAGSCGYVRQLVPVLLPYCLFYAGSAKTGLLARWAPRLRADVSYGAYLWGSPIQQLLTLYLGLKYLTPYTLFLASIPLTLLAGVLSWYLVERHFMRRERKPETARTEAVPAPISAPVAAEAA